MGGDYKKGKKSGANVRGHNGEINRGEEQRDKIPIICDAPTHNTHTGGARHKHKTDEQEVCKV